MTQAFCFFVGFSLAIASIGYTQDQDDLTKEVNIDQLGDNTDKFQELFFEAIAQRAVENPQRAIDELNNCLKLKPKSTAVAYELAKNHIDLKKYQEAEDYLNATLEDATYQEDITIHKQLFHVLSMQKKYDEAIKEAQIIAENDSAYFQEMAHLYLLQNKYQLALDALDSYDAKEGIDEFRDEFRMLIYKEGLLLDQGISFFYDRVQNYEEDDKAALFLMQLYRLTSSPEKAIEVGKSLEQNLMKEPEFYVEMALAYLVIKDISKAQYYSKKVVQSLRLGEKDKVKVINTFKAFALQNSDAQAAFVEVLDSALSSEKNSSSKAELGEFYKSRDKEKALKNFKLALKNKPNDFKLIKSILELELELSLFQQVLTTSDKALESFPTQAVLYYSKGFALGQLDRHQEAVSQLEEAQDYIFEDKELQQKVVEALIDAYLALGNSEQVEAYKQKLMLISK